MKNTKIDCTNILNSKERIALLAASVAHIEAEIVLAEKGLADARKDDGITDPAKIFAKSEDARRILEIRRIEGNREAAKLTEEEERYAGLVCKQAGPIIEHLEMMSNAAAKTIEKEALKLFGVHPQNPQMKTLIRQAREVSNPRGTAHRIRESLSIFEGAGIQFEALEVNLLSALKLLES